MGRQVDLFQWLHQHIAAYKAGLSSRTARAKAHPPKEALQIGCLR
jgi:hypothetical protein